MGLLTGVLNLLVSVLVTVFGYEKTAVLTGFSENRLNWFKSLVISSN